MAEDTVCFKGDDLLGDLRLSKVVCVCVWGGGVVKSLLMITVFQQRKLVFSFVKMYWQKARPRR